MPFMKATGMNTAITHSDVASTANPISLVPLRAAVKWSSPRSTWRTMFSRTTIASSIRMPIASESAISVIMFMREAESVDREERRDHRHGQGESVITVERQELRNMNTIRMVSAAPSISVFWTSSTEFRIHVELSWTVASVTPLASGAVQLADDLLHPIRHLDGVGARGLADFERHRALGVHVGGVALLLLRIRDPRHLAEPDGDSVA